MPTCQIHQKDASIICPNPALEGDPERYCILHSRNKDKDEFKKAVGDRWARSRGAPWLLLSPFPPPPVSTWP